MSSNVMSAGIMAPLNRQLTEEEREDFYDKYGPELNVNYEGTLVYTDNRPGECGIMFGDHSDRDFMLFGILGGDLHIIDGQARTYSCYWYNGVDSDMDMLTLDGFLTKTGQA